MKYLFLLGCFFVSVSVSAQDIDPKNTEPWQYTKTVDAAGKELTIANVGDGGSNYIIVTCRNRDDFTYKVRTDVVIGRNEKRSNLMYRIDKKPEKKITLNGFVSFFADSSILWGENLKSSFLKDVMEGGENLIIKVTGYDDETGTEKFTLKGAAEAVGKVVDNCRAKLGE